MHPQKHQQNQASAATALLGVKQNVAQESAGKPAANSGQALGTPPEQSANESGVSPTLLSQPSELGEGDPCPECGAPLVIKKDGDCSCHINPPCWACVEAVSACDACGHEVRP